MIPRTHILVVSYARDYELFTYLVRSYKKFATGFTGMTVVVPHQDEGRFRDFCNTHGVIMRSYFEARGKEFLHHQVIKLEADLWVPRDTEVVCHLDSDCYFAKHCTAGDYFYGGLPRLTMEHYEDFRWYPARYSWKRCVDYAIGGDHQFETMTQHPELYWIETYRRLRDHIEGHHHFPFTQFILLQRNEFPQTFAEFPTIGAFALDTWPQKYQKIIEVHHPGSAWADPRWKQFGIEPHEWSMDTSSQEARDKIQGWSSKAIWITGTKEKPEYEDKPLPNPVQQNWSHAGAGPYRDALEKLLA